MHVVQATSAAVVSQAVPLSHGVLVKSVPSTSTPDLTITTSQVAPGPPVSLSPVPASPASVLPAPMCTFVTKVTPAVGQASKVTSGSKATATQQLVTPKMTQATIQLPANFQIPPGTVLIKSANGQLMLVSQQALARAQAQVQNAKQTASSNGQAVRISNVQAAVTPSNVAKVSPPLVSKAGPLVSAPTVVKICTTPQTIANSQGTSAVLIKSSAPSTTPMTTLSCTLPSTAGTVSASTGVSSAATLNASTVTVVPVRTSTPPLTPLKNSGASVGLPATIVSPATTTPTASTTALVTVNAVNSDVVQTNNQQATASTSTSKVASSNICITTTTTATSAPIIICSTVPASTVVTSVVAEKNPVQQMQTSTQTFTSSIAPKKPEPSSKLQSTQQPNASESMDNVKKCKNFLATLIKLASSGPQSQTMGQNVKNLVKNLLDSKLEPEEFTTKLYKELKSSPQPYLVPFLKKSLPSLRRMMPNSQDFILQCGPPNTPPVTATKSLSFVKITPTTSIQALKPAGPTILSTSKVPQATISVPHQLNTLKAVNFKQLVVQPPAAGIVKHVTTLPPGAAVTLNKSGERQMSLNTFIQAGHLTPVVKQITLPGNKVNSLQASLHPIKENGTACFREEDDINDVTSMAGVNLNEENACILATNSELVGTVIRSCKDEPFLFTSALHTLILDIGKRHDIKELNSDVMNLVSHATQERLRGLIEKLTVVAQHRYTNYKQNDRFVQSNDVRGQLKFLEQLEHVERQRKCEEEREMILRAAKSRSNKEDPEQIRLKQKAKELQQLELEQLQYREANLTALAAIGPRRKRPLESSHLQNVLEEYTGCKSSFFRIPKTIFVPRITRVSLRDLIFCMEQERTSRHSLSLYRALLK